MVRIVIFRLLIALLLLNINGWNSSHGAIRNIHHNAPLAIAAILQTPSDCLTESAFVAAFILAVCILAVFSLVIFYLGNLRGNSKRGTVNVTVEPRCSPILKKSIVPPIVSTKRWEIASPKPVPP